MRRLTYLLLSVPLIALACGPVLGQPKSKEEPKGPANEIVRPPAGPNFKHLDGQMLVFIANGVGGSTALSDNLYDVNSEHHVGLKMQIVPWSRKLSSHEDLRDTDAQINAAAKIACQINVIRRDAPNAHIFLIGHSAGARVVLAAAEMSPEKSIDRVIVLAPAVSYCYDLTRALKATKYGIDNFWSSEDLVLDHGAEHWGTADGLKVAAAGKVGFRLCSENKEDIEAYRGLRQIRWNEDYCGNGGHCAWVIRHNLRKAVVPLFFCAPVNGPPPTLKMPPAK